MSDGTLQGTPGTTAEPGEEFSILKESTLEDSWHAEGEVPPRHRVTWLLPKDEYTMNNFIYLSLCSYN
jgi:hypothetical protein